jgi:hypothetical protein
MIQEKHSLLETLQQELAFIERGAYRKLSWRPQFVFEDSPTCVNRNDPERRVPCSECVLMPLVPEESREKNVPCRHIPLNAKGETMSSLYHWATQEEIESVVTEWLKNTIEKLEQRKAQERVTAPGA